MSMDNMQLKQESILGDEQIVLDDINPITNTNSIDDSASGEKLNRTLVRLWEAINNKLSRDVNSVNGRTGVVVLTSDDVGLGNVDNVSFFDIKQWVIDQIESTFGHKHIRLYSTYQEAVNDAASNDRAMSWSPFYCEKHTPLTDNRAVIGYFAWDSASQTLTPVYRTINTIGFSDNSIIYRTSENEYAGVPDHGGIGRTNNIPVGGIGVNIYPEEDPEDQILYIMNPDGNKDVSGLRVDPDKVGSLVYYCDTPYGVYDTATETWDNEIIGMLWKPEVDSTDDQGYSCTVVIDGIPVTPTHTNANGKTYTQGIITTDIAFYINKKWDHYKTLRNNDIIFMRFSDFITRSHDIVKGVCADFSLCQPAIGVVKRNTEPSASTNFTIEFYSMNPNTNGYGITTLKTHQDGTPTNTQLGIALGINTRTPDGTFTYEDAHDVNISGLNTLGSRHSITSMTKNHNIISPLIYTSGPELLNMDNSNLGSLFIQTDGSIYQYPYYQGLPTNTRLGSPPEWVENKFYQKNGDVYSLVSEKPDKWEIGAFINYYVKRVNELGYYNPTDKKFYSTRSGDQPPYSYSEQKTGEFGKIYFDISDSTLTNGTYPNASSYRWNGIDYTLIADNIVAEREEYLQVRGYLPEYTNLDDKTGGPQSPFDDGTQLCTGSLISTNYSLNPFKFDDKYISNPDATEIPGLNNTKGFGGTQCLLGLNFVKSVDHNYIHNSQRISYFYEKTGWQYYNISGFYMKSTDFNTTSFVNSPLCTMSHLEDFNTYLGIPDAVDANGRDLTGYLFSNNTTGGIAINRGRFLEITPKKTYRAEKYDEGGKLQVRIGKGLTEETDEIELSDILLNYYLGRPVTFPEPYQNMTINKLKIRYIEHPEEFTYEARNGQPAGRQPMGFDHQLLQTKPDDWDTNWWNYERNIGEKPSDGSDETRPIDEDFVYLPYNNGYPIGFDPSDYNYMGPYYKRGSIDPFGWTSIDNIVHTRIIYDQKFREYYFYWTIPKNRITLDLDNKTLGFNDEGQLSVISNIGGDTPGRNIRFIDTRGVAFDTIPAEEDPETHELLHPIDEVMEVGPGLKITGAGALIPLHMKLWGSDTSIGSGDRAQYKAMILEIWDNMSFGEKLLYFVNYGTKLGIPYNTAYKTKAVLEGYFDSIRNKLQNEIPRQIQDSGDWYNFENVETDFTSIAKQCQVLLTDPGYISYSDQSYMIDQTSFYKFDLRKHLGLEIEEIHKDMCNITRAALNIDKGVGGVTPPSTSDCIKVLQYFYDHYGMGTVQPAKVDNFTIYDDLSTLLPYVDMTQIGEDADPYILDWAYGFFTYNILIAGGWRNIIQGQYEYTKLDSPYKPTAWERDNDTINSLAYFYKENDTYKSNMDLLSKVTAGGSGIQFNEDAFWKIDAEQHLVLINELPVDWGTSQYTAYVRVRLLQQNSANTPANWEDGAYLNYLQLDTTIGDDQIFEYVSSDTAPTYAPNTYYVLDQSSPVTTDTAEVFGFIKIHKRVAYTTEEFGSNLATLDSNKYIIAPPFRYYENAASGNDNVWQKVEGSDTYTVVTTKPVDWYKSYTDYYRRTGSDPNYTYTKISRSNGRWVTLYAAASEGYYSRQLVIPTTTTETTPAETTDGGEQNDQT